MNEPQSFGVKGLSVECFGSPSRGIVKRFRQASGLTVDRIADKGVANMHHVNPDLMRAPGLEPAFDQRSGRSMGWPETLQRADTRDGMPAAGLDDGHALAV